uniref:PHD-type domain-containing protein n=1 Tax=Strongyloides papillosus TaxID=174720 RepID=A0A0N5CE90_STREA
MEVTESTNKIEENVIEKEVNEKLEDVATKTKIIKDEGEDMEIENKKIIKQEDNDFKCRNNLENDERNFKKELSSTSSTEQSTSQPDTTNADDDTINGEDEIDNIIKPDPVTVSDIYETPSFAEIFVFYNTFSSILRLKPITFATIEKILTTFDEKGRVDKELINMQLTLIRRAGNPAAKPEKFEQAIFKLAQYYPILHSISEELEEVKHYSLLTIKSKLFLWKIMCLAQFDYNTKFKEAVANSLEYCEYSFKPMGFDKDGRRYFGIKDCDGDIRIFREDIFVKNEESGIFEECFDNDKGEWKLVVKDDNDLENLLKQLKGSLFTDKENDNNKGDEDNQENNDEKKLEFVKQQKKHCIFSDYITPNDVDQKKKAKLEKKAQRKHKKSQNEKEAAEEEVADDDEGNVEGNSENSKELRTRSTRRSTTKALSVGMEEGENDESQDDEDEYISDVGDDDDDYKTSAFRKPGKRGRKKGSKKARSKSTTPEVEEEAEDEEEGSDEEQEEEIKERKQANLESVCHVCSTSNDQNLLLICDKCDNICIHLYCCKPKLYTIPEDDWFCPDCHHKDLVDKLEILYKELLERKEIKLKEEERKNKAAEALKRELALISVNLNGMTPLALTRRAPQQKKVEEENSDDISDDDGTTRKSKKLAMRKVCRNTRKRSDYDLLPTIAEGRSRRSTKNVDYRFKDYDEQIDGIVGEGDEEEENETKETSKIGRRKKKEDDDDFELEEASDVEEDDDEEDEDMYVPPSTSRSGRRGARGRRNSDDEFINDGSDSDYNPVNGKKRQRKSLPRRGPGRRKRNNYSSEEDEDELSNGGSTPDFKSRGSSNKNRKRKAKNDLDFYDSDFEITTTGRHVRKAAKVVYKEDSLSDEDSNSASKSGSRLSNPILPTGSLHRRRVKKIDDDDFKLDDEDSQGGINSSTIPTPPPANIPVLIPRPAPRKLPQQDSGKPPLKLSMDVVCRPPPRRTNSSSPTESSQVSPAIVANPTPTSIPSNNKVNNQVNGENTNITNKQQAIYVTKPVNQTTIDSPSRYQQVIVPQGAYIVQQPIINHQQNIQVISSPYHSPASTVGTAGYALSQSPLVYQNSQNWAPPSWQPGLTQPNPQLVYHVNGTQGQMYTPMGQNPVVITNVPQETDRNNLISGALSSDLTNL